MHPGGGHEDPPPVDALIPPTVLTREEPGEMPERRGPGGPPLPRRKGSFPGMSPNEKSQAEARQSAVEAV